MAPRHFHTLLFASLTLWVWPIAVYVHTRNLLISIAYLGIEIIAGAILLFLWAWACAKISDLKDKRIAKL
jgi:hypothetical protein